MMEEWEKAWAAAMLDSRGHVLQRNNKQRAAGSRQLSLMIDTAIPEIAERLCAMTGTSPEPKKHHDLPREWLRRGCEAHCPEAHVHMRDVSMPDTIRWSVTGAAAAIVLWNLRKYMTTNHEPWDWALSQVLTQLRLTGQGSGAIRATVNRLHQLGWDIPPVMEPLITRAIEKAS